MRTWLLVAAERREFDGVLKRFGDAAEIQWPGARFAREAKWHGDRWWMIANGPGTDRVKQALIERKQVDGIISTGLCGALDTALQLGDIVVSDDTVVVPEAANQRPFLRGGVHTADRVAVTSEDKRALRSQTGAIAVEMEASAVKEKAAHWGVPYGCIRVVSDTADDDLPLDFNRYRNTDGDFSRSRIALAAMARPFTVMPSLMSFDRNCRQAALALGDFLADCRF